MININEILEHLKHSKLVLQERIDSLSTTTPEIDELIQEIRENMTQCHNAIERQDIDAFYPLDNISNDLFVKLDWLIVNL
jgi:prefoldin subunit 5